MTAPYRIIEPATRLPASLSHARWLPATRQRKRVFDVVVSLAMLPVLLPLIALISLAQLVLEGRPVFYRAERMKDRRHGFTMLKFRTMTHIEDDAGVSGGHKADRVTRFGRFLRRTRFDEFPQIFNVLAGDMSLVGPRPQSREFVERFHDLYDDILRVPPGITGLDSVTIYRYEGRLLSRTADPVETDAVYTRRCLPRRHRLNMIYLARRSSALDLWIMWRTVLIVLREIRDRKRASEADRLG